MNNTNITHIPQYHGHSDRPQRISFFETQFDHVQTPLTFACWFLVITIAKIAFHRLERIKGILPDSALLLVLGSIFGGVLHFMFPEKDIYLQPNWFFLFLLPPIALDAGYFLPNKDFFQNIGTITVFAVFGTIWNIASIGFTLYLFHNFFNGKPSYIDLILFATLISAVDPVAVICVFEEIHVNQLLYICVFGESLLNDAVTIVLYHTFNAVAEVGVENVYWTDYVMAVVSFFWVSIGGIIVGIVWAILTGLVTRLGTSINVVQPLTCLLFPYLAYLFAESLGLSGILAIVVCGLLMKQYITGNISEESQVTVNYFIKTLSSSCEALIFVFLGLSAVSKFHDFDLWFIGVTLVSCLVYRFIGVAVMTCILNSRRLQKISIVDQFIMGYGGIRGAVCYGLVMSLNEELVGSRNMFATTTIIVIIFTVFVQGGTIKQLVTYLKVKQHEERKKNVFEVVAHNFCTHIIGGFESIAGLHGEYWFRNIIERFNDGWIKPYIMVQRDIMDRGKRIVKINEDIQLNEAITYIKQHGSFAGMPTVESRAEISMPTTITTTNGKRYVKLNIPSQPPAQQPDPQATIPRNQSISVFVRNKFDEVNSVQPVHRYSRHFMEGDFTRNIPSILLTGDSKDEYEDEDANMYNTFPYSKSRRNNKLLANIRKASLAKNSNHNAPGHLPTVQSVTEQSFFIGDPDNSSDK